MRRLQKEAYSSAGELSLSAFLSKLKAAEYKVNSPLPPSSDSIKIMTMHASKGLEFPVVIVADIASGFGGDEREEMPYDCEFGFAPKFYDSEAKVYGGTLLRKLFKLRSSGEELKNEINLFYVACTRAKNNLYILSGKQEEFDGAGILTADCYADMFDANSLKTATKRDIPVSQSESEEKDIKGEIALGSFACDNELYEKLSATFGVCVGKESVQLPVKSSATKLLSLAGEEEIHPVLFEEESGSKTSVESGIAYHRFLQLCDFAIKDEKKVAAQLQDWLSAGLITVEQAELLDSQQLLKILSLPQFESIADAETYREREFLCALSADEYQALQMG